MQGQLLGIFVEGLRALAEVWACAARSKFLLGSTAAPHKTLRTRMPVRLHSPSPTAWGLLCQGGSWGPPPLPTPPLPAAGAHRQQHPCPSHAAHCCTTLLSACSGHHRGGPYLTGITDTRARRSTFRSTPGRCLPAQFFSTHHRLWRWPGCHFGTQPGEHRAIVQQNG